MIVAAKHEFDANQRRDGIGVVPFRHPVRLVGVPAFDLEGLHVAREHERVLLFIRVQVQQNRLLPQHQVLFQVRPGFDGELQLPDVEIAEFSVARKIVGQPRREIQFRRVFAHDEAVILHVRLERLDARQRILEGMDGDALALHPRRRRPADPGRAQDEVPGRVDGGHDQAENRHGDHHFNQSEGGAGE